MSDGVASFDDADAKTLVRARLQKLFGRYRVNAEPTTIRILPFGHRAVEYGNNRFVLTDKETGDVSRTCFRYMRIWIKDGRGWKIVTHIGQCRACAGDGGRNAGTARLRSTDAAGVGHRRSRWRGA